MNYIKNRVALCLSVALVLPALSSEITRAAEIVRQWNYSDADDRTIVTTLTDDGLMVIEGSGYCNPPVVDKPNDSHRPTRTSVSFRGDLSSSVDKRPSYSKPTLDNIITACFDYNRDKGSDLIE